MPKIYVNFKEVRKANYVLPSLSMKMEAIQKQIDRVKSEMPEDVRRSYQIGQRLEQIRSSIGTVEARLDQLHETANYCMEQYEAAEYEISRNAKAFL